MSTSGNWKRSDRFTNDEFIQILPHLELEDVLLTQVLISTSKWIHLYEANIQKSLITCTVCNMTIEFLNAKCHFLQKDHILALRSNVNQIYHPFYTYGKGDIELVRGQFVAKKERERALIELNMQMKSFKKDCLMAQHIAKCIQLQERQKEDEHLIQSALNASIKRPDEMFIKASIPYKDIPKLMYCITTEEWKPAVVYSKLMKNGHFHCSLCTINCSGIDTLNAHFGGFIHRRNQLQILDLRYEVSSDVNKNCVIRFADSFSFSVHEKAKHFFKDKIDTEFEQKYIGLTSEHKQKLNELSKLIPNAIKTEEKSHMSTTNMDCVETNMECVETNINEILGHIGVEYVLKIIKSGKESMYECGLCEFFGDETRMQRHLLNYDHRKKYLEIHYPATIKKFETALGHMRFKEFRGVMGEIVHAVSIEIEKKYGRAGPYTVTEREYRTRRGDLIADVYSFSHASQIKGPSFTNVVSLKEMRDLKDRSIELAEKRCTSISQPVFTKPHLGIIYMDKTTVDTIIDTAQSKQNMSRNVIGRRSRSISPTRSTMHATASKKSRTRDYTRSRSPIRKVFSKMEDYQNIWEIYRREIAIAANEIEVAYVQYRGNPESHPMYEEEWTNFWQKRKKELERDGVDHRAHNFQPEWVQYFKQRIEFLFGEALHKSKTNIRNMLEIPQDAEEDCQRTNVSMSQVSEFNNPEREHTHSNIEKSMNSISKIKMLHYGKSSSVSTLKNKIPEECESEIVSKLKDDHTRVVHVLRLITALEDHLGSLGSKIMDLLSKALEMEKYFDGNIKEFEAKILTASNCKLLEMSMEKLKGILFAGLLDEKKTIGFNRIIQFTTDLLNYAEKMGWRRNPVTFGTGDAIKNNGNICISNEKSLSDTLIDLVGSQKGNQSLDLSKGQLFSTLPVACPPPPTIGSNSFTDTFKCRAMPSGLASFDTKLSIDELPSQQYMQPITSGNHFDTNGFNNKASSVRANASSNSTHRIFESGMNCNKNGSFNKTPSFQNMNNNSVVSRRVGDINRSNMKWKHWSNMN